MNEVDFYFDKLTRIEQDTTATSQRNIMNQNHASYSLYNPYMAGCNGALDIATKQPNVFVGSGATGPLGCNVHFFNKLSQSELTNPNVRVNLQQRSYLTVPFLARGNVDVGQESELMWGDTFKEKKSQIRLSEMQQLDLDNFPLNQPEAVVRRGSLDPKFSYGENTRNAYKSGYCKDKKKSK
jgi:hypothetical protein